VDKVRAWSARRVFSRDDILQRLSGGAPAEGVRGLGYRFNG
jgi:hypothetical protein